MYAISCYTEPRHNGIRLYTVLPGIFRHDVLCQGAAFEAIKHPVAFKQEVCHDFNFLALILCHDSRHRSTQYLKWNMQNTSDVSCEVITGVVGVYKTTPRDMTYYLVTCYWKVSNTIAYSAVERNVSSKWFLTTGTCAARLTDILDEGLNWTWSRVSFVLQSCILASFW